MTGGERVALVSVGGDEPAVRTFTLVRREMKLLHLASDGGLPLPTGSVVGLFGDTTPATLAIVVENSGPDTIAVRIIDRRN